MGCTWRAGWAACVQRRTTRWIYSSGYCTAVSSDCTDQWVATWRNPETNTTSSWPIVVWHQNDALSLAFRRRTGQMFSLGVPSSWTIRSTCWISEVPGSKGLWASSSARMQPTALKSKRHIKIRCLHRQQTHTHFLSNVLILINAQSWPILQNQSLTTYPGL